MGNYKKVLGYAFTALVFLTILWVLVISRFSPIVRYCFLSQLDNLADTAPAEAYDELSEDGERILFYNKETLLYLRSVAEQAEIKPIPANHEALLEIPVYWSRSSMLGSGGMLWFSLMGREYYFVPNSEQSSQLTAYAEHIVQSGQAPGLSSVSSPASGQ